MTATSASFADEVRGVTVRVTDVELPADAAQLVDELRDLETLKCAIEARQARLAVALDARMRAVAAAAGEPPERQGRGIDAQVGFARRESPHRGRILLGMAKVVEREMPHTAAAFRAGRISEHRVQVLVRETACLPLEHRQAIDETLAANPDALEARGTRELEREVRTLAAKLDAKAVAERRRRAEAERRVTVRPAPDSTAYLTALMPMAKAIGAWATLRADAQRLKAAGDARGIGQLMADLAYTRLTKPGVDETADGSTDGHVPVALRLVMTDRALFTGAHDPAYLDGHPVPSDLARQLMADALAAQASKTTIVWLKRLFTNPATGELVAMDKTSRRFERGMAELIDLRDQWCRNPWCGAPIRHHDHVTGWLKTKDTDTPTAVEDGQGTCEQCNHAKQAPGWSARPIRGPSDGHLVDTTTPTGHTYSSNAPPLVDPWPSRVPWDLTLTIRDLRELPDAG